MAKPPFQPEYVTEREQPHDGDAAPIEPFDYATETALARDRLVQYVARHPDYLDRDRDLLLLQLLDATERLDDRLATIKRTLDVLVARAR
jgi:hypothetical protein